MRICAVAGGVGSARFCAGLASVVDPARLTIVVNTGDDETIRGLHVSPDVDTVLYHLAGLADWQRGWGLEGETFAADERYKALVERSGAGAGSSVGTESLHEWFALGDRDLATHLLRTNLLRSGRTLTAATDALRRALGVGARVVPMTDDPVRTQLTTRAGEVLDFQTYFVRRRHADEISRICYDGADVARPAPGVVPTITEAELILVPPSNPLLSIGPVLSIGAIRAAIEASDAPRVAVSPIVGGKALKGPADMLLRSLGHEQDCVGVARLYQGLIDTFVIDEADAGRAADVEALGMRVVVVDTIMSSPDAAAAVAKSVLAHV